MADQKSIRVRLLRKSMQELWSLVFGDEWEYLEDFFNTFFPDPHLSGPNAETGCMTSDGNRILFVCDGERVISQLFMIPYEIGGMREKAAYLYALATHPDYRGRGLMGELIRKAQQLVRESGMAGAFLIPAEETLKGYYEGYGFCAQEPSRQTEAGVLQPVRGADTDGSLPPVIRLSGEQEAFWQRALGREGMRKEEWQAPGPAPMMWGEGMPRRLGINGILT